MTSILLSVTTAPRAGGPDYLDRTLQQLENVQADERWVVTDGLRLPSIRSWLTLSNPQRTGQRLTMWRVFQLAVDRGADFLIYCEDDINVAPGFAEHVKADISDSNGRFGNLAFVSYYDGRMVKEGASPGIYPFPGMTSETEGFCGAQCLLIPRRTFEYLAACDPLECPPFAGSFHSGDCVMGYYIMRSPHPNYGIVVPTLVDHLGDVSAVGDKYPRRGRNFAGVRDGVWHELQRPFYAGKT